MPTNNPHTFLFVLPEQPYPPRKNGFTVRFFPLIQALSAYISIEIALIVNQTDEINLGDLKKHISKVHLIYRSTKPSIFEKAKAQFCRISPFGTPFDFYSYGADAVVDQIFSIDLSRFQKVVWTCQSHYLSKFIHRFDCSKLIVDAVDSMYLWMHRQLGDKSLISKLRVRKVAQWERATLKKANKVFFISPADVAAIADYLPKDSLYRIPNGVFFDDYHSGSLALEKPSIGYLGNMSYLPNIDAALRLSKIFKGVRAVIPEASLYIVGRDPSPEILKLSQEPGIFITGTVEDIWAYINALDIFVMPIYLGAGQQNKLLEVLYASKPAISTSMANNGIGAINGQSVILADTEEEMAAQTITLLRDPQLRKRIGKAGKDLVESDYTWNNIAKNYARILMQ